MRKFVEKIISWRWFIAIVIPLITVLMASNLKHLEFEGSYRIWFGEKSQILKDYDAFRAIFGNDDVITITFSDPDGIFTPKALQTIDTITQKLWQTHYIARVDSLTNYQYVHPDYEYPDEVVVEDFIEDPQHYTTKQLLQKKKIALTQDLIVDRIISKDAKTTMIVGRMTPKAGDDPAVSFKLRDAVRKIIAPEEEKGYHFYLGGGPIINSSFIEIAQHDGAIFTPGVIVVAMFLLLIIFRKISAMFLSISVVIFTFVIVLSIQVMLGYKLNNFTANIPVFVVAIGIADAMHLLWIYTMARKKGMHNHEAIHYTMQKNFLAIFLTSLTTSVGFASLGISAVIPIKTLGIATASAALLAFVLTILFVPAMLAILNPNIKADTKVQQHNNHPLAVWYSNFILKNAKALILLSGFVFLVLSIGIGFAKVDSNVVKYFKKSVAFRQSVHYLQEHLTGPMSYEIIVDSQRSDGIKDPTFMKTVAQFYHDFSAKYPQDVRHISSLMDVIKTFNLVMNKSKSIPDNQELIAQYLLLYSLSLPQGMEINDKMDIDERLLRVTATMNIVETSKDLEMIHWVEAWWAKTPYSAKIEGQTVMFAHMQHDVTNTLIESITLAVVMISLIMLLIFRNWRMLPLFIVPNILPIALVVGVMGWLKIEIDMGVAIAGAIIIGVAVDDTIHFMVKYLEARKRGDSLEEALHYVMSYAGSAIIFTTLVLSVAFLVFIFSDFNPNYHFGIVTASALLIAAIVDLVALPALLVLIDNRKKSLLL